MIEQKDLTRASLADRLLDWRATPNAGMPWAPRRGPSRGRVRRKRSWRRRWNSQVARSDRTFLRLSRGDCGHDEHRSGAHGELRQLGRPAAGVRRLAKRPAAKHGALLFHVDLASSQPTGDFTVAGPWRRERTAGNSRCPGARGSAHGPRSTSRPRSSSARPSPIRWICDSTNGCTCDRVTGRAGLPSGG
jgi:hypothetical protein